VDLLYFSKQIQHSFFKGSGGGDGDAVASDAADASVDIGLENEMI
jgi:hypothetical protein